MLIIGWCLAVICLALAGLALILWRSSRAAVLRGIAARVRAHAEAVEAGAALSDLMSRVESLERAEAERQSSLLAKTSINLTTRGQILRMLRKGESCEQISAALNLPAQEVKLTQKIHQLLAETSL